MNCMNFLPVELFKKIQERINPKSFFVYNKQQIINPKKVYIYEYKLAKVCLEWAKQNLDNSWQNYAGWAFSSDGYININYSYNGIVFNNNNIGFETCYGTKYVYWQDMVEFSKTLEL